MHHNIIWVVGPNLSISLKEYNPLPSPFDDQRVDLALHQPDLTNGRPDVEHNQIWSRLDLVVDQPWATNFFFFLNGHTAKFGQEWPPATKKEVDGVIFFYYHQICTILVISQSKLKLGT